MFYIVRLQLLLTGTVSQNGVDCRQTRCVKSLPDWLGGATVAVCKGYLAKQAVGRGGGGLVQVSAISEKGV